MRTRFLKLQYCETCRHKHRLSAMKIEQRPRERGYDQFAICPKTGADIWLMSMSYTTV